MLSNVQKITEFYWYQIKQIFKNEIGKKNMK